MIIYFLKSVSCLALLLLFYHLILEKEKMHSFNRFYLIIGVIVSLVIPFATLTVEVPAISTSEITTVEPTFIVENTSPILLEETIDYTKYILSLYIFISFLLLFRFGRNLFKIIHKIRLNTQIKLEKASLVLVDDKILPHTFWNFIFINKTDYNKGNIEDELFTHELTHVTQKHTLDVLLIEFLQAIFWINPLIIFLKKAIQLNHEFLADENVINQHKNTLHYQHLLINKAAWNNEYYLASNLNYLLTKKRLKMMTTQSSQTKIWIKKLAVIPLLAGFIFLFAERVEAQQKNKEVIIENIHPEQNEEVYKKYYYKNLKIVTKDKNGKNISKTYDELTTEEKARLIPPPPLKSKKIVPTKNQLEELKDKSKYAVWIDGKVVKNEVLKQYQNSDFSNYSISFVYKNARSQRFPQNYQASLYTNDYFENQNKQRIEAYENYLKNNTTSKKIEIQKTPEITDVLEKPTKNSQTLFNKDTYKDYKYYVDGKLTAASKINDIETYKIKSTSVNDETKTLNITLKKIVNSDKVLNNSNKKSPSSFLMKLNDKENISLTSFDEIKREKESNAKFNEHERKQFEIRKMLIKATTLKEDKFNFKIDGKNSHINDAYTYIHNNPICEIFTEENSDGILTLNLKESSGNEMSFNDLQNEYTKIFKKLK